MADHANHAAVAAAGYLRIQTDRGSTKSPRYVTRYEKPITGGGGSGSLWKAEATSDISQADADTKVVDAINYQRRLRYGAGAAAGTDGRGSALTFDVT